MAANTHFAFIIMLVVFRQIVFLIAFALCGAAVIAGGVMADTVNVKPAEEARKPPRWVVTWCAEKDAIYPLHCAAGYGSVARVKRLVANGEDVNKITEGGDSPLLFAASAGHVAVIGILLELGADVNVRHTDGFTPLHAAAWKGHVGAAEALINAGADVNAAAKDGITPLKAAARKRYIGAMALLINAGADINDTREYGGMLLHEAARLGNVYAIKSFVKAGLDVNAVNSSGLTPLHLATASGYASAIETLVNAGAYHSPESAVGQTPMHEAAYYGEVAAMKALIKIGVNPDVPDRAGNAPLHIVAAEGHIAATEMLIEAGADFYAANKKGKIPLDVVRDAKKWGVVSLLEKLTQTNPIPQPDKPAPNVAVAPAPDDSTIAEHVFESAWRSVVYIRTNDGQGSGIIIRPNIVATNCHVVDSKRIFVYKAEKRSTSKTRYPATIRLTDNKNDFCLLDVKGLWGIPANVRRYDTLRVGESVYGLGAPQGLDLSMSTGIISQKRAAKGVRYIQTDVAISPGSSGGGLFDREGNLVGIMTAKIVGEDVEGIGFAIPADLALE